MNPFDNFDIIYYINLDKREDRKKQILEELTKMNINMNKVKRIPGIIHNIGALGCSLAHLNALIDCNENNYNNCLILEDDFVFKFNKEETFNILNKFWNLETPWDIVMLSGNIIKYKPTTFQNLLKVNNGQTTSGYSVNKTFLPKLLKNYKEGIDKFKKLNRRMKHLCIDIYWKRLQPLSNWYVLYPKLGHQRPGYSDIEKCNVEYKSETNDINIAE